jgi:hypothetical protein
MLLFSRTLTLTGGPRKTTPIVAELTARVRAQTGLDWAVRNVLFGAPLGTLAFTTRAESHAALAEAAAGLTTDEAFLDLVEKLSPFLAAPPQDQVREVIHGEGPGQSAVGHMAQLVTATVAGGKFAAAMAWGVEIADHVASTTKAPIMFCRNLYGPFGQLSWISTFADSKGVDAASAALAADASYLGALDKAGDLFEPGSATTTLSQRVM